MVGNKTSELIRIIVADGGGPQKAERESEGGQSWAVFYPRQPLCFSARISVIVMLKGSPHLITEVMYRLSVLMLRSSLLIKFAANWKLVRIPAVVSAVLSRLPDDTCNEDFKITA